jgi:hypothetical protein
MAEDKQPMQADGDGAVSNDASSAGARADDANSNIGQSGGGAYPHPKNDPEQSETENSFMGHGGQSDIGDHGGDEVGSGKSAPRTNATTKED